MTEIAHKTLSLELQPVSVEERFARHVPGMPVPLVGRVDVRTDKEQIVDVKTSAKGVTVPRLEWRAQAITYLYAWPTHDFEWQIHATTGNLKTYSPANYKALQLANRSGLQRAAEGFLLRAWNMLEDCYERYGLEQPWPGSGLAGGICHYCSYRASCFYWA
jgi:CRISPR/Cas system-associated exonuclease Cas4 (RecB family)